MARSIQVAGMVTVYVDTGTSNAMQELGVTQDGAEVTINANVLDVPTDEDGGTDGPPTDVQWLGETAQIRLQMTKWDEAVEDRVLVRIRGYQLGAQPAPGLLMIGSGRYFRLLLSCATRPYNFPCVVFREAFEINKGTKFSRLMVTGTAYRHPTTRVLYNRDTGSTTTTGTSTTLAA